jgi:branched-chain amino acid transport system ATP-binding protein
VRGSETAAVSLGIDITRYKLLAFAISGGLAGVAGSLIMVDLRAATPFAFQFTVSLFYLSIAVVGGISSLGGAIAASVLFAGLSEAFFRLRFLNGLLDIVTVGLLLVVLLVYPGGLGALGQALARRQREVLEPVRLGVRSLRLLNARPKRQAPPLAVLAAVGEQAGVEQAPDDDGDRPGDGVARGLAVVRRQIETLGQWLPVRPRPRVVRRSADRSHLGHRPVPTVTEPDPPPATVVAPLDWRTEPVPEFRLLPRRADRTPVLEVEHVTVRFGGLVAANDVSLEVREHEIVGLIGPNGAGKTTTFNAISGLNEPTTGTVRLFGEDATNYPVHVRAQMGVGRTFQLIQLFPQLTVFENLLVATHVHNDTGVLAHVLLSDRAVAAESECRQRVREIVALLGLTAVADRPVAGLPFGVLRQVEIARALVTEAPFVMLDEPASGLDNNETDELARLLHFIRAELGVTLLLIEHDVRMVTSVSDYMYVINRGALLAEGTPTEVQSNPDVVAAYLGDATEDVA